MSLEQSDAAAAAVQKPGHPRVTLDDLKGNIAAEYFFIAADGLQQAPIHESLKSLTICLLVTRGGFTIIGKSAPADPANFDPDLGRKFAREDAMRQLWPLMGYALRERLAA